MSATLERTRLGDAREESSLPRTLVRWGIYPLSWIFAVGMLAAAADGRLDPRQAWGGTTFTLVAVYMLVETLIPYQGRWAMTKATFWTDLKYIVLNGSSGALVSAGLGLLTVTIAGQLSGPASDWPIAFQLVAIFVLFEACQYSIHRFMHEGGGRFGRFMWHVHAGHHLPQKLYVLMHAVGHPLNLLLIRDIAQVIPIWLMGYDPIVIACFLTITSMHGLISHFNVDVRIGWMNYVFVGPELHRYHHSSELREAKNFAAILSVFDWALGTLVYRPGVAPEALGAFSEERYPNYRDVLKILGLPFRKSPT